MPERKYVVLVVEDEPIIRMGAVDLVVSAGFDVVEASSADEAIRILEARSDIRLVFTDVGLPGSMDGLKLAHYVRDRWPPTKLIVVCGHMAIDQSRLPIGTRFFPKPYRNSAVLETLLGLLPPPNYATPAAA
jgi:two-component system, response regulator PdtaR